jgi:DNA-binding NtrC family response regulator
MTKPDAHTFRMLAVDDNPNALEVITRNLVKAGYEVVTAASVEAAVGVLAERDVDIVITDYKMPRHSGLDLIKHVRENHTDTEIIMITGYASIDGAVEAIKEGAEEYLAKPFTDTELLTAVENVLNKLIRRRNVRAEMKPEDCHGIVGNSAVMRQVFRLIAKAAPMNANVLISGESGTGKELVARAIHYAGPRSSAPFVPVNCTAIPDSLLESELFGHVKGAFTGANSSRAGFFQIADGGTIFLDEIGDASLNLQSKLLRVIQNKEIFMVGSSQVRKVDARIIAATHKDLAALVKKEHFREDLFYRLNVIDIHIPPLRERPEDVPPLVNYFVSLLCREMKQKPPSFSDKALEALINYSWPGNIRELENLLQRLLVIVEDDLIDVVDLPHPMRFCIGQSPGAQKTLAEMEAEHIARVLAEVDNNKTRAAEILGIDRKTLREKLKRFQGDAE